MDKCIYRYGTGIRLVVAGLKLVLGLGRRQAIAIFHGHIFIPLYYCVHMARYFSSMFLAVLFARAKLVV